jgi:DUF4097 and DUF4098 domain-containing protein YvlB
MKRTTLALLMLAFLASLASAQKKVDERLPAETDGLVRISNLAGSVRVSGWDKDEISVTGTIASNVERLEFSSESGLATVKVVMRSGAWSAKDSEIEVRLPAGSSLDIETASAKVDVEGVKGKMRLVSVSGAIRVEGPLAAFIARSTSGSVDIAAGGANGRAQTISGNISIVSPGGDLSAESVSGNIAVRGGRVDSAALETTSGGIRFDADLGKGGRLDAKNMSGSVDLTLNPGIAADFELSTFSGKIDNGFRPDSGDSGGQAKSLSFSTGKDARVKAESFSGNVRVSKRD